MAYIETELSIGVAGALGPALIARIARRAEAAGAAALWVNDTAAGDSLAALAAAAEATSSIRLATGVLPLDRRPARTILEAIGDLGLPVDRLVLGVGSGQRRAGALALVRDGVAVLREGSDATVMVGALGPRMRALAATSSAGPLLSWLPPDTAAAQGAEAHALAAASRVALYARCALDVAAVPRMLTEADWYGAIPSYAASVAQTGSDIRETVIPPAGVGDPAARIDEYRGTVDELVLRAIVADDTEDAYAAFIDAAEPLLRARGD